jgi:predicted ribosomally synthesized peptide with SipW-like signal peptide
MIMSLLVIALAAALIGGATMAWFTDSATSDEVTFTAGTLLIGLDGPDFGDFRIDNLNPGDKWCTNLVVFNDGTKNMKFRGCLFDLDEVVGQSNEALDVDMRALLVTKGYGNLPLSDVLTMTVFLPTNENGVPLFDGDVPDGYTFHDFSAASKDYFAANVTGELCCQGQDTGYVIYSGPVVADNIFGEHWLPNNPFAPGETIMYKVCFELPSDTGNAYQGSSISGKFGFGAGQWREDADYGVCASETSGDND